jgi:hypothetical protein
MRSTQQQQKRIAAEVWFKSLVNSQSRYSAFAYDLKRRGFTYCQIMDYFAGKGFK